MNLKLLEAKMRRIKIPAVIISMMLVFAILFNFTGCVLKAQAADLMEGIEAEDLGEVPPLLNKDAAIATDFAIRLFRACNESGKNTLISPLSVMIALAMTANGAVGQTKTQMETVLGMSTDDLNSYFRSYMNALPSSEKVKFSLANSIWFTSDERFTVNKSFLQTNANYYGADAYKVPFDNTTLKAINDWVKDKTDGMIPEILDKIPADAIMYLVNALAFEAEWANTYTNEQITKQEFTQSDGTKQTVDFMFSNTERYYLEDEKATGFIKNYVGHYAFVAMLPKNGVTVDEYISYLDGQKINNLLSNPVITHVVTLMPKFETEYSTEMSEILKAMGMPIAFSSGSADFSNLGRSSAGNIYIGRVIHKTFISVAEKGTKAGAATVIEMRDEAAYEPMNPKEVYLTRPFVYMLIDTETNVPFFIGTLNSVK